MFKMIRIFRESEINQLHEMIQKTIDVSYSNHYPTRAVQFFQSYHSKRSINERHQRGVLLIVESNKKIVATGSLVENEISGVFVLHTKQKQGLGKQIMFELEARAKNQGISEITLDVSLPSRKFYENLDYQISEPQQLDVGEGQTLKYWKAKKRINS